MANTPQLWHHAPAHVFEPGAFYMVTAGTYRKLPHFRGDARLRQLQQALFEVTDAYGWGLQAWAVFANHYHFIARAPEDAPTLKEMVQRLHSQTARQVNRPDHATGRRVWFQYWDTCLTYERSYLARLKYVHTNPVKHGAARVAERYPFCSARWFRMNAEDPFRRKVDSFRCDRVNVRDDF
ncbi:MAG: transposase [Candidatus Brocadiia bacterium]